jgi:DNA-binding MarR family transcriptional regulator
VPVPPKVRQMARECVAVRTRLLNRLVTGVCDAGLRPFGVKVATVNVLCAIANSGPVTPTELAAALVLDKSTLSRDMAKLLEKGWVETQPGDDARSHQLVATADGVAFLERIHPVWADAQRRLILRLGPVLVAAMSETVNDIWNEQSEPAA